ncbi:hypothetical protein REPUB_Repub03eG0274100 [Reevesia pubescens]
MAGFSLSWFLPVLLEKLDFVLKLPGFPKQHEKSASLLESLKSALTSISKVITDAEKKQLENRDVKIWLQDLEDAVYDAEDVVDKILYDETTPKLKADKPRNLIFWALGFLPAPIKQNGKRMRSIRKIVELIDGIAKNRNRFDFREQEARNELMGLSESESNSLPVSTCLLDETAIYGREEDRSKIVSLLLSDSGDDNLDAIALVGRGGLGKTTLAQQVYKDEKVSKHFELKAWVDASMDFDVRRITIHSITRKILEASSFCSCEGYGLQELHDKLSETLAGKKFILVLDDVWQEDTDMWDAIKTSLKSGAKGSKIIVITRKESVAVNMGCSTRYLLHPLTVENCWSILAKSAFAGRDTREVEALEDIGRQIVEKCLGVPLLARAIGGLLRFKKTLEEWCHVLDDLRSLEIEAGYRIPPILLLSYYRLPAQLKPCFAYCSLFPTDYEFDKEELILLWEAEGFLQQSTAKSMKKVGAEYFNGLLKRSFFIPLDNSQFKMHHLMHDLAVFASQRVCLRLEFNAIMESAISKRTRHLSLLRSQHDSPVSLLRSQHDSPDKLSVIPETKRIKTFRLINSPSAPAALTGIFASLQGLRVLSLPHFQHAELPASLGQLKYLRYLDFSDSALISLPESLCTLYYLRTLILTNCSSLLMLPKGIVNLVNLRNLHIKGAGLNKMPEEMSRLTNLQSLTNFIVGHGGSSIRELGSLPDLHGSLSVSMLQNVSSASDALAANLKAMRYLDELELEWSCKNENPATDQEEVLENLKPFGELKKLSIRFYGGKDFPKWLGDSSFLKITSLHLGDCKCELLPPLGQLSSLEHLIIERISGIKRIGHEFFGVDVSAYKPFQSLKTLKFEEMSQWEEWMVGEAEGEEFPSLLEFYIINCPKLEGHLPKCLPSLIKLEISECQQLGALLPWTSEHCVLKLENCDKVQKISDDNQTVEPQFSSSIMQQEQGIMQQEQDDNQTKPSSSEDGSQQFSSSLGLNVSSVGMEQSMELPVDSNSLRIERYASNMLPKEILERSSLQHLYIIDCIPLKIFPLSPSLKTIYIHNCKSIEFPRPNKVMNQDAQLEDLCLGSSCDSLKIFPLNYFPKLKSLSLWDCRNLEYLSIEKELQNELTPLDALEIKDCPNLRSFLEEEFQAPNLTSLVFFNCGNLKSMQWMQSLKSLQSLYINKCPALESLPVEGLPSGLIILSISFCDKITPQKGWKLDKLHSLSHFEIEGGCQMLESFPEEGLLPTNLNSLRISRLLNLTSLDREGLQKLTSLQTLEINCCNKLDSLPENRLLSSLYSLSITDCSLLNPKLQSRKGKEWFKIAHIPSIHLHEVSNRLSPVLRECITALLSVTSSYKSRCLEG